jgi:hypothetical protein
MIRIDEIYNNTFWPWIDRHHHGTRMFFCDPPGRTDIDALFNYGNDNTVETDYIFFHDQEPIHLDVFCNLFDEVFIKNLDISRKNADVFESTVTWPSDSLKKLAWQHTMDTNDFGSFFQDKPTLLQNFISLNKDLFKVPGHIVVSELGEYTETLSKVYGWQVHYYFYHGWACQDWFRGYDKSFLIPRAKDRMPTKTFMSPNRIVAGKRDHRVLFLYNIFKKNLENNHISAPRICPSEGIDITSIAQKYSKVYQDITNIFTNASLPKLFNNEDVQKMSSCWLDNFDVAQDSLIYVPTETVYFGNRLHITEKTFKAIALEMPFVLVAPAHSLEYMRSYGFKTFNTVIDESYDTETDDIVRIEKVTNLLKDLDSLSVRERQQIHRACLPMVEHNYNHFYQGGLSDILWTELTGMLNGLHS